MNYCYDCKNRKWMGYGFGWGVSCMVASKMVTTRCTDHDTCEYVRTKIGMNCPMYTPTLSRRIYAWWHGEKP